MADEISAEHEARAQRDVLDTRAWLNDPASSNDYRAREAAVNRFIAASGTIERARSQREAARQETADAARLESLINPDSEEGRIRAAIRSKSREMESLPEGHPRTTQLVDEVAFLTSWLPGAQVPSITDSDYRTAMATGGLTDRAAQDAVLDALEGLGLEPAHKLRAAFAIQHSQPEQIDAEEMERRLRSWWGDKYDANYEAIGRVWELLTPNARRALTPRRGSRDVIDALLELARR
jgi:hypothetical protein